MNRKYLILFSLSGLILSLDQFTKYLVYSAMELGNELDLIPGFLALAFIKNNGFAFGLLKKAPESFQEIFFIAIPVFALVLIVLIFIKLRDNQVATSVALTCILAGAVGNLIDRIQHGYVVDFLRFHLQEKVSFPIFNVADCAIIVGVGIMFFKTLHRHPQEPHHA